MLRETKSKLNLGNKYFKIIIALLIINFANSIATNAATIYVDKAATGANDGTSWTNAYINLQDGIEAAVSGDEIWVAAATYVPTMNITGNSNPTDNRTKTFRLLKDNIKLYGGFNGTETALNQRDVTTNITILSGDLGGDDVDTPSVVFAGLVDIYENTSENAYNVVNIFGIITANTLVDGFTIRGGTANNANHTYYGSGGGMFIESHYSAICAPTINNCTFIYNNAATYGAAIYNHGALGRTINTSITNCTFEHNLAGFIGGTVYNNSDRGNCNVTIKNSLFNANKEALVASSGVHNYAGRAGTNQTTIINCIFTANQKAISNRTDTSTSISTVDVINCNFYNNEFYVTGHASVINNESVLPNTAIINIHNSILWENQYPIIFNSNGVVSMTNTIYHDGTFDGIANVPAGVTSNNVVEEDPQFVSASTGNLDVFYTSPVIDKGDGVSGVSVNMSSTDIAGNSRFYNTTIDIGAYEKGTTTSVSRVYVDKDATGENNGTSWANAFPALSYALALPFDDYEIWVADGTYYPLQSVDTDENGVIEEREKTFYINKTIRIYGGFNGTETAADQRDEKTNITILSGDIGTVNDRSDNAYHVFWIESKNITANIIIQLSSLTIQNGYADGTGVHQNGAGIYCIEQTSDKLITSVYNRCTIINNKAINQGGGVYLAGENPGYMHSAFSNTVFHTDTAQSGAAIYIDTKNDGQVGFFAINSLFHSNYGEDVIKSNNPLSEAGIYGRVDIRNCTFSQNKSSDNSAMIKKGENHTLYINNSIFWDNDNNTIAHNTGSTSLLQCIYDDGTLDGTVNLPSGVTNTNNMEIDPLFIDVLNKNFRIQFNSPAREAGQLSNAGLSTYDLDLNPRLWDDSYDIGAYEAQPLYVDVTATGANDGSSWTNAFTNLQDAIDQPLATTIWVADGTYYPTVEHDADNSGGSDNREKTFYLSKDIVIYGGFAGTETKLFQRDPSTNVTILSGDLGILNDNTDNAYHVLYLDATSENNTIDSATIIDGFTIQNGNADGSTVPNTYGGSIYIEANVANAVGSPIINNCIIDNSKAIFGGGLFLNPTNSGTTNPTISNCIFSNNTSVSHGGAVYSFGETNGTSSPSFINSLFYNNQSGGSGAAISSTGVSGSGDPQVINCTFSNNLATTGGIVHSYGGVCTTAVKNTIIWANTGAAILNQAGASATFDYGVYDDGTIDNSVVLAAGTTGSNNLDSDPYFADTANNNYALSNISLPINNGDAISASSINTQTKDLAGNDRFYNSSTIDIGAYEYQGEYGSTIIYVKHDATGLHNGLSWSHAYTDLQDAIDEAKITKKSIWVAAGTYNPTKGTTGIASGRANTFYIDVDSLKIYGGFAGSEIEFAERNTAVNETILSGDIGTQGVATDNIYRIFHIYADGSENITAETIIDGFTITGGYSSDFTGAGAAIYNSVNGTGNSSKPFISNCKFIDNYSRNLGGAIANLGSANGESGGTYINCLFTGNSTTNTGFGGAIYQESYNNGTINTQIINCTFDNNTAASYGGHGIYNIGYFGTTFSLTVTNSIFWSTSDIKNDLIGNAILNNSIYYDGAINNAAPVLPSGVSGTNNLDSDPLFTNAATNDYSLQDMSPAINVGDAATYNAITNVNTKDLANNQRFYGNTIDIGAYENQATINLPVELLDFTATLTEENTVLLEWQTATEINNDYFDVEWSTDGIDFEKLDKVQGAGTTNDVQFYEFTDTRKDVLSKRLNHYYRLKQVDFDGEYEYSKIVNITVKQYDNETVKFFPNPANDILNIETNEPTFIQIRNISGQILKEQQINSTSIISVKDLPSGIYFIKAGNFTKKLVIQH